MRDLTREKYAPLMVRIEELEEMIEAMNQTDDDSLAAIREELAARRSELARISDGCGKPRPTK